MKSAAAARLRSFRNAGNQGTSSLPAALMDLYQARAFAQWRNARLPTEEEWQETKKRIADLFGDDLSRLLNASTLAGLGDKFNDDGGYVAKHKADSDALPNRLQLYNLC